MRRPVGVLSDFVFWRLGRGLAIWTDSEPRHSSALCLLAAMSWQQSEIVNRVTQQVHNVQQCGLGTSRLQEALRYLRCRRYGQRLRKRVLSKMSKGKQVSMIIRYKPFGCRAIGLVAAVSTIVLISATVEAGAQFKQLDPSDTRVVVPKYRVKPRAATICPRHR